MKTHNGSLFAIGFGASVALAGALAALSCKSSPMASLGAVICWGGMLMSAVHVGIRIIK